MREKGPSAFTEELLGEIDPFSARIESEPDLRAGIITGTGRTFSLGTDLLQLERGFADPHVFRRYLVAFNRTMSRVEALPVPIVAAVNGRARAGGLELVLACLQEIKQLRDGFEAFLKSRRSSPLPTGQGGRAHRLRPCAPGPGRDRVADGRGRPVLCQDSG